PDRRMPPEVGAAGSRGYRFRFRSAQTVVPRISPETKGSRAVGQRRDDARPLPPAPAGTPTHPVGGVDGGSADLGPDALTTFGLPLLAVSWGANFSVIKVALVELSPMAFNALRFPLASLVLCLILRSRGGKRMPERADLGRV